VSSKIQELGIDHHCQVKDFVMVVSQKQICKSGNITTFICLYLIKGLPRCFCSIEFACQYRRHKRHRFNPWFGKICWNRKWQPTPVFLPGKSHGQRCLVGYSLLGHKESDRSDHAYTHGHLYLIKKDHTLSFLKYTSQPIDKGLYVRTELPEIYGFLRALDIINIWGK